MANRKRVVIEVARGGRDGDLTRISADQRYAPVSLVDEVTLLSAAANLPAISGLFFHLDAQSIAANDGTRISAWTDEVTGTVQAVQATAGQQPLFQRSGINGRPAVYFDTARNDALVASGVTPGTHEATVFVVATRAGSLSGNRYVFGTSGHAKNLYASSSSGNPLVGVQSVSAFTGPGVAGTPHLLAGVFNGAASMLRVDGVSTDGSTGTATSLPAYVSIGHRYTTASGQGWEGPVGEVMYYNRALTTGECQSVERYLSAKWGIPVTPQSAWYLDTVHGNDENTGRTISAPVKSLTRAFHGILARKLTDATLRVTAPADAPIREEYFFKSDGNTLRIESAEPGKKWYMEGSQRFIGGWTDQGGGVYSRSLTIVHSSNTPRAFVPTLLNAFGQPTRITERNTTTPTTPAEGELGFTGGVYYLHLPGGANPNLHTVEVASVQQLITAHSNSKIYLRDAFLRGAQVACTIAGSTSGPGGYIEATDCIAEFSGLDGFATRAGTSGFKGIRCEARYVGNDGFNHTADAGNTAIMELIDCDSSWNDDEGVSPHGDTRLILRGGRFHHNGNGGLTAVGSSQVQLYDSEFDHNGLINTTESGVNIDETATLISTGLYSHDNVYRGIRVAATATWTDNGGTRSGIAEGNGAEDAV